MKSNASLIYSVILVLLDLAALVAAFGAAFIIRANSPVPVAHPIQGTMYLLVFAALLPFWLIIFALLGLYTSNIYERRFAEFGRLLTGAFIGLLFVVFWNYLSVNPIFPAKLVPLYGFGIGFALLLVFRNVARLVRTELFSYGVGLTNVLVVGSTLITDELVESLGNSRLSGYRVLGTVGVHEHRLTPNYTSFKAFLESTRAGSMHGIIQTELYKEESRNREILGYAQTHHVAYRFVPGNTELFVGNIDVELFRNSVPVIAVRQTPLYGWGRVVKRVFDLVVGLLALVVTSWLFVIIIIAELLSGGAVFYRQQRLTRYNNTFGMFKFRTIKLEFNGLTPEEAFTKMGKPEFIKKYRDGGDTIPNDPRFTRLGKILRTTSLDELPQLLNIIKGDISLVGPRPLIPQELSAYEKKHTILSVKSGLTGLAVVSGRRDIPYDERRKLDIYYVQNWSFGLDLIILAKTVRVILERTGAK